MKTNAPKVWTELLGPRNLPLFALLCLGVWLNAADTLVTATIMPSVAVEIGGYAYFAWASTAFLLGAIIAGASAGRMAERFGLRRGLSLCAVVYMAGCVVSALAPDIGFFLAGRLLQGFGAGWIVGLCFVSIRLNFAEPLWAPIFAALTGVWGVATLLGPLLGGLFAGLGLWRVAFWAFALQSAAFAVAAPFLLKPVARLDADARLALPQLALLTAGVLLISAAGVIARPLISAPLVVAGLAVLGLMLRLDGRAQVQLLPREAGDLTSVAGAGFAMMVCLSAAAIGFSVYGPGLLQALHHVSPLTAGYVVASESIGWTITALAVSHLPAPRHSAVIRLGALCVLVGLTGIAVTVSRAPIAVVGACGLVMGGGFGLCWSFTARRILASLPPDETAIGSAALPTLQLAGNAVGAACAGVLANLLGLAGGFGLATAQHAGPWLFTAFIPVAGLAVLAAYRVGANHNETRKRDSV
jgi:MFS family permease